MKKLNIIVLLILLQSINAQGVLVNCPDQNDNCNYIIDYNYIGCDALLLKHTAISFDDNDCMLTFRYIINDNDYEIIGFSHDFNSIGMDGNRTIYEANILFHPNDEKIIFVNVVPLIVEGFIESEYEDCTGESEAFIVRMKKHFVGADQIGSDISSITTLSQIAIEDKNGPFFNGSILKPQYSADISQRMEIRGTLKVDIDYTYSGTILMHEDAKIIVESGINFSISQRTNSLGWVHKSNVSGCQNDGLWNSIEVQPNSTLNLFGCEVRNAKKAVHALDNSKIFVSNSTLCNNIYGIYAEGAQFIDVTSSKFLAFNDITRPDFHTESGIHAENVSILTVSGAVGFHHSNLCLFDNLDNGIYTENTYTRIRDTKFSNMNEGQEVDAEDGVGVYALGRKARITKLNSTLPFTTSFADCKTAVYVEGHGLRMNDVKISEVEKGIHLENNVRSRNIIAENDIMASVYGILADRTRNPSTIINNKITLRNTSPIVGGGIVGLNASSINAMDNEVYLSGMEHGIRLVDCRKSSIKINEVYQELSVPEFKGISLYGCEAINVGCNDVIGLGTNEKNSFGFYVHMSEGTKMYCNTPSTVEVGFKSDEMNLGTDFKGNEMNGCYGLQVQLNSVMDIQGHRGNCWLGGANACVTAYNYNNDGSIVKGSRFIVDETKSCLMPDNPLNDAGVEWFKNNNSDEPYSCTFSFGSSTCNDPNPYGPGINVDYHDFYGDLIDGGLGFSDFVNSRHWTGRRQLFTRMAKGELDIQNNSILSNFYQNNENDPIGVFTEIESGLKDLSDGDAIENVLIESQLDNIESEVINIEQIIQIAEGSISQSDIIDMEFYLNNINIVQGSITETEMQIDAMEVSSLLGGLTTNNSIVASNNTMVSTRQAINQIYLSQLEENMIDLGINQLNTLTRIADLCPAEGGQAVLRARAILEARGNTEFDNTSCSSNGQKKRASVISPDQKLNISPQPANDHINVELSSPLDNNAKWSMYNLSGQLINTGLWPTDQSTLDINITDQPHGMYIFELKLSDEIILLQKKFVIVR